VASALLFTAPHPVAALARHNAAAARQGIAFPRNGQSYGHEVISAPRLRWPSLEIRFSRVRIGVAEYEEGRFWWIRTGKRPCIADGGLGRIVGHRYRGPATGCSVDGILRVAHDSGGAAEIGVQCRLIGTKLIRR
jgi:hypothetical protein